MAGGSNVWPRLFVALYEAAVAGDVKRVVTLHQRAVQFDTAVYRSANPVRGLKCALSLLGICSSDLTLPLQPHSQEERDQVQKYLQTVDVYREVPSATAAAV
jgi:4-hydroxy-tetrahydrodipicolinate synthase